MYKYNSLIRDIDPNAMISIQIGVPATRCFLLDQNILFLAVVIEFQNLEFTGKYTTHANFNRDLWKTQNLATKKLTPPSFFEIMA